jgi:histone-lysine N-methyltransferase SETD1
MDSATGAALGVALVRFANADDARRCVEKEDGARGPIAGGASAISMSMSAAGGGAGGAGQEERRAVLDPEGAVLKALLREMDERRKREREERRRREKEAKEAKEKEKEGAKAASGSVNAGTPRAHPSLPLNPSLVAGTSASGANGSPKSPAVRHPLVGTPLNKAHHAAGQIGSRVRHGRNNGPVLSGANAITPGSASASANGNSGNSNANGSGGGGGGGGRRRWNHLPPRPANSYRPRVSRSPSPDTRLLEAATQKAQQEQEQRTGWGRGGWRGDGWGPSGKGKGRERDEAAVARARAEVRAELASNGRDHLKLRVEHLAAVRDEDVTGFMQAFVVDKVRRDFLGCIGNTDVCRCCATTRAST